uniref:Uncharacterized protein n=1 Tax=Borely moumouvirus TaxID=2712067 RepID=A0A6G6ABP0_9VIRU
MKKLGAINLTYDGPYNDIVNLASYYEDGTMNVKYTLLSLKNLLLQNVNVIDKLLENNMVKNITIGDVKISVEIESVEHFEKLVEDEVLVTEEEEIFTDYSGEIETNQDRLNRVLNMTNINETEIIFGQEVNNDTFNSDSESSESESETNLLNDDKAHKYLFNAFELLMNSEKDICSDSD